MNIAGARICITGGGSGLGLDMASTLSAEGAEVAVLDRDEAALERMADTSPKILGIVCDVTDPVATETAVEQAAGKLGGIDVVINNAGVLYSAPLLSLGPTGLTPHPLDDWRKVLSINLDAVFYVTRAATQVMIKKRTRGLVLNISSVSAPGNAGQSAYSAAKAAVESLTVTWSKELGPWGIRVVAVAPGFTDAPSTHAAVDAAHLQTVKQEAALKRLGAPEHITHTVRFAIENDFLTGTTVRVDGGLRV